MASWDTYREDFHNRMLDTFAITFSYELSMKLEAIAVFFTGPCLSAHIVYNLQWHISVVYKIAMGFNPLGKHNLKHCYAQTACTLGACPWCQKFLSWYFGGDRSVTMQSMQKLGVREQGPRKIWKICARML